MTEQQKRLYDSIVHGLRTQGWSKIEAESEALDRVLAPSQAIRQHSQNGRDNG